MSKIFFISDTHFNHKNVLIYQPIRLEATIKFIEGKGITKYSNLNLNDLIELYKKDKDFQYFILDEHNEMIIAKWNNVVDKDDVVWHLGDVGFGNLESMKEIVSRLNGNKKLILGNHDTKNIQTYYEMGFKEVHPRGALLKRKFLLTHEPNEFIGKGPNQLFNIFGHVHGNPSFPTETSNSRCVCVERQDFQPIRIMEFERYEAKPFAFDEMKK